MSTHTTHSFEGKNMESEEELLDRVKKALVGRYLTFVAEKTGLHYNTVWKIAHGKTKPNMDTLHALSAHLFG
jgi:predicted transcriptional regulator